jgi:hypothetical protein
MPLAIAGLVLLAVLGFALGYIRRGEGEVSAVQEARVALHFLAMELREASGDSGATAVWSRADGAQRDGVGFFSARADAPGRAFAADSGGGPRWLQAVYYVHDPSSGELRRMLGPTGDLILPQPSREGRVVARRVKGLAVSRQGDLVTVKLTVEGARADVILDVAARPRN